MEDYRYNGGSDFSFSDFFKNNANSFSMGNKPSFDVNGYLKNMQTPTFMDKFNNYATPILGAIGSYQNFRMNNMKMDAMKQGLNIEQQKLDAWNQDRKRLAGDRQFYKSIKF